MKTRKKTWYLLTAVLLFIGCNEEPFQDDITISENRVLSLIASMPGNSQTDNKSTRVALSQEDDRTISLAWQANDELHLSFIQDDKTIRETITISSSDISPDGKKASFEISIPEDISDGVFDLYGVYGGGGLSSGDPTIAILPTNPGDAESLSSLQERKDLMLTFSAKDVSTSNATLSTMFKHMGSLFAITFKNVGNDSFNDLAEARLISSTTGWAYNNDAGGKTYDLISGEFQDIESAGNYLSFKTTENTIESNDSITFWGWYPPLPGVVWPELKLELRNSIGEVIATTTNSLPPRTEETLAGKSFYFFSAWSGTDLQFTNSEFEIAPDIGNLTLLEYIDKGTDPTLSLYADVINYTSLNSEISSGNRTRIVPTNNAINTLLNLLGATAIEDVPKNILKEIFLYQIIDDEKLSTDIAPGEVINLPSLNGDEIYFTTLSSGKLYINNNFSREAIEVIQQDFQFKDGIAHFVDIVPLRKPNIEATSPSPDPVDLPFLKSETFPLLEDSHVTRGQNNKNYNSENTFQVAARVDEGNYTRYSYIKFELPEIDFSDNLQVVQLKMYCSSISGTGYEPICAIYPTSNDWDETTITWNNKPAFDFDDKLLEFNVVSGNNLVNITEHVKDLYTENKSEASLVLRALNGQDIDNSQFNFYQREYTVGWAKPSVIFNGGGYVSELEKGNNLALEATIGSPLKITKALLSMEPKEDAKYNYTDNNIIYVLSTTPANGFITVSNLPLKVGDQFTQAEIAAGVIKYVYNGINPGTDSFQLNIKDYAGGTYSDSIDVNITIE